MRRCQLKIVSFLTVGCFPPSEAKQRRLERERRKKSGEHLEAPPRQTPSSQMTLTPCCEDDWDEADYEAVEKADGKANESSTLSLNHSRQAEHLLLQVNSAW